MSASFDVLKSMARTIAAFSLGFGIAVAVVPVVLGAAAPTIDSNTLQSLLNSAQITVNPSTGGNSDFDCGSEPTDLPPGGKSCPKFTNIQIGGGPADATDGGLQIASDGKIFINTSMAEKTYGITVFGKGGVYAQGFGNTGKGVVGALTNDSKTQVQGILGVMGKDGLPYGVYTENDLFVGKNIKTKSILSPQGDIDLFPQGSKPSVFIHGNLKTNDLFEISPTGASPTVQIHGKLIVDNLITAKQGCEGCTSSQPSGPIGVYLEVQPTQLGGRGGTVTLSWGSSNAFLVKITVGSLDGNAVKCKDNGKPYSIGSCIFFTTKTTTFYATAVGQNNEKTTAQATVTVPTEPTNLPYRSGYNTQLVSEGCGPNGCTRYYIEVACEGEDTRVACQRGDIRDPMPFEVAPNRCGLETSMIPPLKSPITDCIDNTMPPH